MPKSQVIEIREDGVVRRCGTLLPDQFPVALAARDAGQRIFSQSEILGILSAVPAGSWLHNSRDVYDPSIWILDQSSTAACNGNATAAVTAKKIFDTTGRAIPLSGGDAYSQMNDGVDNGSTLAEGLKVCVSGIAPLKCPHNSDMGVPADEQVSNLTIYSKHISQSAKAARTKSRGHEPQGLDSLLELATWVILYKFAIVAVQAGGKYSLFDANGVSKGGNGPGNHSVHIDDIRLRNGHIEFDQPNSWGWKNWGQQGRIVLSWDRHLRETVKRHRFWGLPLSAVARDLPNPK